MRPIVARPIAAALAWAAALACGGPRAAMAQPGLSHVSPGALAPGKTTDITLHGTKLDGEVRVWTSFPAQVVVAAADSKQKNRTQLTCQVTLGPGVAVGIGGIVVATGAGVSDVAYVMIDDLPSIADEGKNHEAGQPQVVSLPAAIDGQCDGTLADYYRFAAKGGEPISCEIVATRLGWDFDALVRVLDSRGNELILADDDPASGADPRFVFTAPADGQYVLELRDNRYKPGGRYRLRLGDFPLVSTALPLVAQRGVPTDVSFRGSKGDSLESLTFMLARLTVVPVGASAAADAFNLSTKLPGRRSSGWTTLGVSDLPAYTEATSLTIPCIAGGVLELPRERDLFQFQGVKGTPLRFRAITRSAGSPAIVSLLVLDSAGKQLSVSPVTDSDEPVLSFSPPADGAYRLAVEELAGRGGGDFTYAIECKSGPQFSLQLKNDKNNRVRYSLPVGGAFYLDVQCQRAGYDGPIVLALESPRWGWQVFNNTIAAKTNEVRMYVSPPIDFDAGELADLRVIGRAASGGSEIAATMATMLQLRAARPQLPYPPRWQDGTIYVSGQGAKPAFFSVSAKSSSVDLPPEKGESQLTLEFERTDPKFKDVPLTVVPLGLPSGVTAQVNRNGNGPKETYDIVFNGGKGLADGEHAVRYFAYAELAGQGRGVMSGDIRLKIGGGKNTPAAPEVKAP